MPLLDHKMAAAVPLLRAYEVRNVTHYPVAIDVRVYRPRPVRWLPSMAADSRMAGMSLKRSGRNRRRHTRNPNHGRDGPLVD